MDWRLDDFGRKVMSAVAKRNYADILPYSPLTLDTVLVTMAFARTHDKKYAEIDHMILECGAPVLIGAAAHFECRNEYRRYGGDHIIFIGHVERYAYTGK